MREIVERAASSLGYSNLKPEQEQAILAFVSGKDVFVALPTGYGKSPDSATARVATSRSIGMTC